MAALAVLLNLKTFKFKTLALTVNFSASQVAGSPQNIVLEDLSTGTDVAVVNRRVYISTFNGTFLVEQGNTNQYSVWADYPATTTINLDVLSQDQAVNVTVQWCNVSGAVLYDKTLQYGFTLYNETFNYGLTQMLAANPLNVNDNDFFNTKAQLQMLIDAGNQAIELASDLYNAQLCYNEATRLRIGSQYFFNINA